MQSKPNLLSIKGKTKKEGDGAPIPLKESSPEFEWSASGWL